MRKLCEEQLCPIQEPCGFLKPILGYDYLWLNVRVKGGAYGVMNSAGRSGEGYFVSYRDPNLKETDQVFEGVADYLEQFDADRGI